MARPDKRKLGTVVDTFGFHPTASLHPGSDVRGANDPSRPAECAPISGSRRRPSATRGRF